MTMNFRNLPISPIQSYEVEQAGPSVAFECPVCNSEISLSEIVEKNGSIRCVKCI